MMPRDISPESLGVSRETFDQLSCYVDLIQKWSPKINLVAKSTLSDIWQRHILDSHQLSSLIPSNTKTLTDIGSGGGLPAVVLSITRPDIAITMIESDKRKATFLRTCVRELELSATVVAERIETSPPMDAQIVTARALAPLPLLLDYVHHHLHLSGTALLMKGRATEQELADARKTWSFNATLIPSQTSDDAHILKVERIARA